MGKDEKKKFSSFKELGKAHGYKTTGNGVSKKKKQSNNMVKDMRLIHYFPKDTAEIFKSFNEQKIDNFHLKLNKAAYYDEDDDKFIFYKNDKNKGTYETKFNFGKNTINKISNNYHKSIEKLGLVSSGGKYKLSHGSRLIVGLGSESIYETSMTLHHIYGIPYIPGQAVKGICRNWFLTKVADDVLKDLSKIKKLEGLFETFDQKKYEKTGENYWASFGCSIADSFKANGDQENSNLKLLTSFQFIFGTQNQQGRLIFFDAFPTGEIKLKTDIMTPHYGDYYNEGKPPADYYNPVPIPFLTVENTTFQFMVGVKKRWAGESIDLSLFGCKAGDSPVDQVSCLVKQALKDHGIGAKTAVGYGYFEESET